MSDDNHFAALRSAGWSRTEARQILRDAAKGDSWAKADISRARAAARKFEPLDDDGNVFWGLRNGLGLSLYLWAIIIGASVSWMT